MELLWCTPKSIEFHRYHHVTLKDFGNLGRYHVAVQCIWISCVRMQGPILAIHCTSGATARPTSGSNLLRRSFVRGGRQIMPTATFTLQQVVLRLYASLVSLVRPRPGIPTAADTHRACAAGCASAPRRLWQNSRCISRFVESRLMTSLCCLSVCLELTQVHSNASVITVERIVSI